MEERHTSRVQGAFVIGAAAFGVGRRHFVFFSNGNQNIHCGSCTASLAKHKLFSKAVAAGRHRALCKKCRPWTGLKLNDLAQSLIANEAG